MSPQAAAAADLLFAEAEYLDLQQWDQWLALYADDCEFWMPAWKGEHRTTEDPAREVSLVYYSGKAGLADRVWRVRQGNSVASAVLPRTQHVITNVSVRATEGGAGLLVKSCWTVHQYLIRESEVNVFFGRYEHTLTEIDGTLRIAKKKIILLNDYLPSRIDFYSL